MIQSMLTKETPEIIRFFRNIGILSEMLDKQEEKLRPVLNGERYITDCELAEQLKLTRRTLAEYRINGKLPYYKIGGKLLYRRRTSSLCWKETGWRRLMTGNVRLGNIRTSSASLYCSM